MKTKLIILAIWLGLVAWYGYETVSIYKESMELQYKVPQLKAVDQE